MAEAMVVDVLLVDDDHEDFLLTRELIGEIGSVRYRLEWAPDYDAGLRALRQGRHAICLLDQNLGPRTGLELLREALGAGCTVPIIMLTGESAGSIEQQVLAAGAADYLVKGRLDADLLWRALRHALERNRAFEDLRQRDRQLRAIFNAAQDAMLIADDQGRCLDVNPAALALFRMSRQELLARRVPELTGGRRTGEELWAGLLRDGVQVGEVELLRVGAEPVVLEYRARARILSNRHLVVLRDITEHRRAERTRARLSAVVESAEDAILVKDADGTIREWNHGAERIYGYPAAEAIGGSVELLVPVDRLAELRDIQERVAGGQCIRNLETVRLRKDGRRIDVSLSMAPLRDADGRILGACTITRDITETNALRARLAIADRMASVGTLAAGVAHEINNPLAAVLINVETARDVLELARGSPAPGGLDEVQAALQDTVEAARRVRDIVRDLKLFSRPDDVRKGPVDVRSTLDTTLRMVWNEVRHRAHLTKEYGEVPLVDANESRLGQVFLNLLVNAAHAIPEGSAHANSIRVTTRTEGGRAVVEISDTGCGIPRDVLNRIFEPFFTTKPLGQGTGLGLPIVNGIVHSLGGDISVVSEVGSGTTFRVSLPAGRLAQAHAGVVAAPAEGVARRARVLVVDDEQSVIRAIRRLLSGHDVVGEVEAASALRRLQDGERFDVILCDLMMPEMTGMDLHAEVAKLAPEVADRMVFSTGGAFTPRARRFLDEAKNRRIDKPFDPEELLGLIRDLLEEG